MPVMLKEPDVSCPAGILRGGPTRTALLRMLTAAERAVWKYLFGSDPPRVSASASSATGGRCRVRRGRSSG